MAELDQALGQRANINFVFEVTENRNRKQIYNYSIS